MSAKTENRIPSLHQNPTFPKIMDRSFKGVIENCDEEKILHFTKKPDSEKCGAQVNRTQGMVKLKILHSKRKPIPKKCGEQV